MKNEHLKLCNWSRCNIDTGFVVSITFDQMVKECDTLWGEALQSIESVLRNSDNPVVHIAGYKYWPIYHLSDNQ